VPEQHWRQAQHTECVPEKKRTKQVSSGKWTVN
jgi:hypothetical protein